MLPNTLTTELGKLVVFTPETVDLSALLTH